MLSSLDHHELLVFWAELLVIYTLARLLGAGAQKLGLPSVVGELSAGVVLGPSLFGSVWEGGFDWFLPGSEVQSTLLLAVSWFSAAFLLLVAGFETDLPLIRRLGRAAALVTLGSLLVPLVGGLLVGSQIPDTFYGDEATRVVFTLFIGVSVSVSALAVVAKILGDLELMRRDVGQITVAVGMANDLVGWIILGVIAGLAVGDPSGVGILLTVAGLAAFLVGALTLGQRVVDVSLRYVRRDGPNVEGALTVMVGAMLGFGVITQWLGVEAVLGAFVAGVVLARSRYRQSDSQHIVEALTSVVFAPLFFATAGLRLDLGLLRGEALLWAGALLAVALVLKFLGSFLGARAAGLTPREGMVLGAGLNARGALEIIIATVGLSLGVLNETSFTMIVMIPLVTSLVASIGVRLLSRDLKGSTGERERLAQESSMDRGLLVRNGRLLIPSRGEPSSIVAAQVAHFVWPENVAATVLGIQDDGGVPDLEPIRSVLYGRTVDVRRATTEGVAEQMIAQSKLGYSAMVVGVDDSGVDSWFVSRMVDEILGELHVPIVLVRGARNQSGRLPGIFARALVPVTGGQSSRAAQELAGNMSSRLGTEVLLSHVVYSPDVAPPIEGLRARTAGGLLFESDGSDVADRVLQQAAQHVHELRANYRTEVRFAVSAGEEILRQAAQSDSDLIVLGSKLRRLEGRPFLGQNVEFILRNAMQTVVVAVIPESGPSAAS